MAFDTEIRTLPDATPAASAAQDASGRAIRGVAISESPVEKTGACGPITYFDFNDFDRQLVGISSHAKTAQ